MILARAQGRGKVMRARARVECMGKARSHKGWGDDVRAARRKGCWGNTRLRARVRGDARAHTRGA